MIIFNFTILLLIVGIILAIIGNYMRRGLTRPYSANNLLIYSMSLNISAIGYGAFVVTALVLIHLAIAYVLMK